MIRLKIIGGFLLMALFISSCKKDEVEPDNEAFVGTYKLTETYSSDLCGSDTDEYSMTITKGSNDNEIIIYNLANNFDEVIATVSGTNFTITSGIFVENTTDTDFWDLNSGSGSLNGNTITVIYNADDILYNFTCGYFNGTGTGDKL